MQYWILLNRLILAICGASAVEGLRSMGLPCLVFILKQGKKHSDQMVYIMFLILSFWAIKQDVNKSIFIQ